jgi:hypothetical protein
LNSAIATGKRPLVWGESFASGVGAAVATPQERSPVAAATAGDGESTVSTRVFHESHSGQRPSQRGVCPPHVWQT